MALRHRQGRGGFQTRPYRAAAPHPTPRIAPGEKKFGTGAAPVCPKCGGEMALRTQWGAYVGESFWGCTHYPRCRGTLGTS
jgi:restriction system protein